MDYKPEDKQVFEYYDGEKRIKEDALVLYSKLMIETKGQPNSFQDAMKIDVQAPDAKQYVEINKLDPQAFARAELDYSQKVVAAHQAKESLVALARKLFTMAPYNRNTGGGADAAMCLKVWRDFADYLSKKNEMQENSPTSSMPTGGQLDTPSITEPTLASS